MKKKAIIQEDAGEGECVTFAEVFAKEIETIRKAREKRQVGTQTHEPKTDLIGLAFSGGGMQEPG